MPGRPGPPDGVLAERAQDGDTSAFETLVLRHQDTVFRVALRTLGDRDEAADTAQEALITAWRRLPSLRDADRFRPWLLRIAARGALDAARARAPEHPIPEGAEYADPAAGPANRAVGGALRQALDHALADLPPPQRICWILREMEGLGYEEIADVVEATPTAVRGRIHRARTRLVEALEPWR